MKKFDVVLIGSGISALTAASLLARSNKSVCILEQHYKLGGLLHGFKRFGEHFDTGAHYIGALDRGQSFRVLLEYLGVFNPDDYFELDPQGFDVLNYPDFTVEMAKGYRQTIENISSIFPGEKKAITQFFSKVREVADYFPTYNFKENFDAQKVLHYLNKPLQSVLDALTPNKRLQAVLCAYCYLHGVRPSDVSFGLHALITDSLISSAYSFSQGGDPLAQRFVKNIEALGGEVFTRKKVARLDTKNGEITQVICEDGDVFYGDWVISSAHPAITFSMIDASVLRPAFKSRLKGIANGPCFYALYGRAKGKNPFARGKNYYYFQNANPATMFEGHGPTDSPSALFLGVPNRGSEGGQASFPLTIHGPGPLEWFDAWAKDPPHSRVKNKAYAGLKREIGQAQMQWLERRVGKFNELEIDYVSSTPLSNAHFTGSHSAYGIYHSIRNTGPRALGPRTHIRNLLLTGQNTLFPGIMAAAISGLRTSGHIIGTKGIIKTLQQMQQTGD